MTYRDDFQPVLLNSAPLPKWRCPACGYECEGNIGDVGVTLGGVAEYDGNYCTRCLFALIAANVPKLERVYNEPEVSK